MVFGIICLAYGILFFLISWRPYSSYASNELSRDAYSIITSLWHLTGIFLIVVGAYVLGW